MDPNFAMNYSKLQKERLSENSAPNLDQLSLNNFSFKDSKGILVGKTV